MSAILIELALKFWPYVAAVGAALLLVLQQRRAGAKAERAKQAGYPERFAQEALGHNSKAVHRMYARHAQVSLPSLEDYEGKIIPMPQQAAAKVADPERVATA